VIRILLVASGLLVLAACDRKAEPAGRWANCACDYLTDRDEPGRIDVELCAPPRGIDEMARTCAQGLGVGNVSQCRCEAVGDRECPKVGECREAPGS